MLMASSSLSSSLSLNPSPFAPRFLQTPNRIILLQFPPRFIQTPIRIVPLRSKRGRSKTLVLSAQSNFLLKVVRTAWNIGKDGIEAGTKLVPVSVPRPVARISVTIAALSVSLFLLKSLLSTAFFVVGTMGFAYFLFIALNKDEAGKDNVSDSSSSSSNSKPMDDPLEEANRIMDKYK